MRLHRSATLAPPAPRPAPGSPARGPAADAPLVRHPLPQASLPCPARPSPGRLTCTPPPVNAPARRALRAAIGAARGRPVARVTPRLALAPAPPACAGASSWQGPARTTARPRRLPARRPVLVPLACVAQRWEGAASAPGETRAPRVRGAAARPLRPRPTPPPPQPRRTGAHMGLALEARSTSPGD